MLVTAQVKVCEIGKIDSRRCDDVEVCDMTFAWCAIEWTNVASLHENRSSASIFWLGSSLTHSPAYHQGIQDWDSQPQAQIVNGIEVLAYRSC